MGCEINDTTAVLVKNLEEKRRPDASLRTSCRNIHQKQKELNASIDKCLNELREIFHKISRFSSRNEALEEISKLLFSHITSIVSGESGISRKILEKDNCAANCLKAFVSKQFKSYVKYKDYLDITFELNIKDNENQFAEEIISVFEKYLGEEKLFKSIASTDILNEVFGKFLADSFVDEKQLGQYLTPPEIVAFTTELIFSDLDKEAILADTDGYILDPSCGAGSFLSAFIDKMYSLLENNVKRDKFIKNLLEKNLVGIDKSERMLKLAITNLSMFGYTNTNLYLKNALNTPELNMEGKVSIIMTNPPFGAEFSAHETQHFNIVSTWPEKRPKKVNSEILFIEKYIEWLKPGGILACIIPDSILNNKGLYEALRNGIAGNITIKAVISLPPNTFASTGTETKTSLLYLKKEKYTPSDKTYMAICANNGYDVISIGSHKTKRYNGASDLTAILEDYKNKTENKGQWIVGLNECQRWDAAYHALISKRILFRIKENYLLQIKDVAKLSNERFSPKQSAQGKYFNYIEISDVDANQLKTYGKKIPVQDAPSRARKIVHPNDVLVSTVRPERGIVAVVDEKQDGYICTTGFAVLSPQKIDSMVLALLLQSEFVILQIKKYAMGISYPVIDEKDLLNIYLPISKISNEKYTEDIAEIRILENKLNSLKTCFKQKILSEMLTIE